MFRVPPWSPESSRRYTNSSVEPLFLAHTHHILWLQGNISAVLAEPLWLQKNGFLFSSWWSAAGRCMLNVVFQCFMWQPLSWSSDVMFMTKVEQCNTPTLLNPSYWRRLWKRGDLIGTREKRCRSRNHFSLCCLSWKGGKGVCLVCILGCVGISAIDTKGKSVSAVIQQDYRILPVVVIVADILWVKVSVSSALFGSLNVQVLFSKAKTGVREEVKNMDRKFLGLYYLRIPSSTFPARLSHQDITKQMCHNSLSLHKSPCVSKKRKQFNLCFVSHPWKINRIPKGPRTISCETDKCVLLQWTVCTCCVWGQRMFKSLVYDRLCNVPLISSHLSLK